MSDRARTSSVLEFVRGRGNPAAFHISDRYHAFGISAGLAKKKRIHTSDLFRPAARTPLKREIRPTRK